MLALLLGRAAPWLIAGAVVLLLGTTAWSYRERAASMQAERDEALNRALRAELSIRKQAEQAARDATLVKAISEAAARRDAALQTARQKVARLADANACPPSAALRGALDELRAVPSAGRGPDPRPAAGGAALLSPGA